MAGWLLASGCATVPEGTLGQAVTQGAVTVTVTEVRAAWLDLEGPEGAAMTQRPVLLVSLQVNNGGETPLRYDVGWSTAATTQAQSPLLFVDPGPEVRPPTQGNIPTLRLGTATWPGDPVTEPVTIAAGASQPDVLLFDVPAGDTRSLLLSLPPTMFGPDVRTPAYITLPWTPSEPSPPAPVDMSEAWESGNLRFRVTGLEQTYLALQSPTAQRGAFTSAPVLKVNFEVTNTGSEPLTYLPPEANRSLHAPALSDGQGGVIARAQLPSGATHPGHINERTSIAPGATLHASFLFEQPSTSVEALTLQLPARRFGGTGLIRIAMPFRHQSVPVPPELTPQPVAPTPDAAATP
jgi:hypothetical protein